MPTTTATAALLPAPVLTYCDQNRLLEPLQTALRLVERAFGPTAQPRVSLEPDPETDEEYLVIDVATNLPVDEAVGRKQEYTRLWVQAVPPAVIGKIRLVLDIS
jgi:hypothetical protein